MSSNEDETHLFILHVFNRIFFKDLIGTRFEIICQRLQRNLQAIFVAMSERFQNTIGRFCLLEGKETKTIHPPIHCQSTIYSCDMFQILQVRFEQIRVIRMNSFDDELHFQLNRSPRSLREEQQRRIDDFDQFDNELLMSR